MNLKNVISVLTVDDHPVVRDGLMRTVQGQPDMEVLGEATNGEEAVEMFRKCRPLITLMDLRMPGMDGITATSKIREINPNARIIVLTSYSGDVQAVRALKAGAAGYLLKGSLRSDLINAIRAVHDGRRWIPGEIASGIAEHLDADSLTSREVEVLQRISSGGSNKIVASAMGLTEETIKGYVKSILSKLGVNDRTHAVTIALKRGYLDL